MSYLLNDVDYEVKKMNDDFEVKKLGRSFIVRSNWKKSKEIVP